MNIKNLDDEWLRKKYVDEKLPLREICKSIAGTHPNTIKRKLNKMGVELRGLRDSHMVGKSELFIPDDEVIKGTLLGDGSILMYSKTGVSAPRYSKFSSKEDYAFHIASHLHKKPKDRIFLSTKEVEGKFYEGYSFRTTTTKLLTPYYEKWYSGENHKKIVPKDLILTPRIILYWFMDDGYTIYRDAYIGIREIVIGGLCSESFSKEDNEFLCNQLKNMRLSASVRFGKGIKGTGYRIFLNQTAFPTFWNIIGVCPIKSMEYKWKHTSRLDNLKEFGKI